MELHYYPETDSLYLAFRDGLGVETREVADGLNVDLDDDGQGVASISIEPRDGSIFQRWKRRLFHKPPPDRNPRPPHTLNRLRNEGA